MIHDFFSSDKNINIINNIINDDITKEYNTNINQNHRNIINKNISFVKSKVSKNTPKNMSDKDYLLLMNQKVYDLSIDNIKNDILNNSKNSNNINNNNNNINNNNNNNNNNNKNITKNVIRNTTSNADNYNSSKKTNNNLNYNVNNNLFDNEIIKSYETPQVIDYPKPGNNEKTNVSNQFEKVQNERETLYPKQEKIDFSIKADDKNNTVDLYNDLLGTYNKQLQSMENFENENKDKNNTINELENIDQLNYELSKLTPLNELFNNEQEKIELNLINKNIGNIPGFNRNDASIVRPTNEITIPVVQQDNGRIFGSTTNSMGDIMLKEPKFRLYEKSYNIVVNSKYRDLAIYSNTNLFQFKFSPQSNNFLYKNYLDENKILIIREKNIVVGDNNSNNIGEIYDNITSIELKTITVPTHTYEYFINDINNYKGLNIFHDNYLLLEVPEIRGPYQGGGNTVIRNSFAKLNIQNSTVQVVGTLAINQLIQPFTNLLIEDQYFKYSPVTHGKVDKMTLKLLNKNGRLYNFGIDKLYFNNISKGNEIINLCGSYYSTKFELIIKNEEYNEYCNIYYNICNCDKINNICTCNCQLSLNPLYSQDLLYFYTKVPNNDQFVLFEKYVKIDSIIIDKTNDLITLKLYYKMKDINNNKKIKINFEELFNNFDIYSALNTYYYFVFIYNNNTYYVKIKSINKYSIDLEYYQNFPDFTSNLNDVKIGVAKSNQSGLTSDNKNSLFSIYGYNVISSVTTKVNDITTFTIEISYPYDDLPDYLKSNYFSNGDLFLIQDKNQIAYTFQIKTNVKDYDKLESGLNESGNN